MAESRFDSWPPVIPKVGETVQIKTGDTVIEGTVLSRALKGRDTFRIMMADPFNNETNICLEITPSASGVDGLDERKPYWRIVSKGMPYPSIMLFFLD